MENNSSLQSAFDLCHTAYDLTVSKAKVLYSIAILNYLIGIPLVLLAVFAVGVGYAGYYVGGLRGIIIAVAIGIVALIVMVGLSIWIQVALLEAVINNIGFKESFKIAKGKVVSYLITSLIAGLIVFLGFIIFIVPGIIFIVWYGFAAIVVVAEGLRGMAALRQSKSYVKGRWGAVAWRLAAPILGLFLLQIIIALVFDRQIGGIIRLIVSFLAIPFLIAYHYLLYKNLKDTVYIEAPMAPTVSSNETPS
ncbi:MAG TPA: hypothetical protein VF974_05070 [Patescibacteria group bacterium]